MAKEDIKQTYDNNSISTLKECEAIRTRPSIMLGSDSIEGCEHAFFEILSNSIDEAKEGYGKEINVTIFNDTSMQVEDFGRGIPLDYNENEKEFNWFLVFCRFFAGSKYHNNEGGQYTYSLGYNGVGAAATQFTSEYMDVYSYRDGQKLEIHFEKGQPVGELIRTPLSKKEMRTGTVIKWKPDKDVFTDTNIPKIYYEVTLERQAIANSGIKVNFKWENSEHDFEENTYTYENGITEYMQKVVGDKCITQPKYIENTSVGRDREDKKDYTVKLQTVFCFTNENNFMDFYHNSSYLIHNGASDRAVKVAFTYAIDKYLRAQHKIKATDTKILFSDIEDSLAIIVNSFSTDSSYENQTKKAVSNEFIYQTITEFLKQQLEYYFAENPKDAIAIAEQVLKNKKAREAADSTRIDIKKALQTSNEPTAKIEKFVSCRSKDVNKRELYIVEGDSALTSCKLARDAEFQALIPVRGKTLNCLKASIKQIFDSDIIKDLLKLIGCGVEIKGKKSSDEEHFNLANLKWDKIIICTDADVDGFQIRTLILTMFYRLLPTLISEGKVYIAETPLFEITSGKDTYFAYNEKEKNEILSKLKNSKYTIQRSKGLGENDPEMMWQTTMNPETRHLIKITEADSIMTNYIFETLLGDNLSARKSFIQENGKYYIENADI